MQVLDSRSHEGTAQLRGVRPSVVFTGVAALLLPLMIALSFDFGYTWDEKRQQKMGEEVWEYWTGVRDRSAFAGESVDLLYGELFDVTCIVIQKVFPRADTYVVRHAVNAVYGWIAVLAAGLLARALFGGGTGILAMVLLAAWPLFFGHSMNNPKDVPFAALFTFALCYVTKVSATYPYVTWRLAAQLGGAIGLAIAIRAVGVLLFGYLGIVVAVRMIRARDFSIGHLASTAARLGVSALAALLLPALTWPWALGHPVYGPILAFFRLSKLRWEGSVLYRGEMIPAMHLPWHYVPTWLLITAPFVVLIGAVCSLLPIVRERGAARMLWLFFLAPIVLVIARQSTLYDGIRHLLFLLPLLAVLSAAGWTALLAHPAMMTRRSAAAALCVTLSEPFVFSIRNHPNEAVYFNALTGGPSGAFGRYELDYWGNCALQAVDWADHTARQAGMPVVLSGGNSAHVELNVPRFRSVTYQPSVRGRHHLVIQILRGSPADLMAADRTALFRVRTADGAPLCAVQPGPLYSELETRLTARASN